MLLICKRNAVSLERGPQQQDGACNGNMVIVDCSNKTWDCKMRELGLSAAMLDAESVFEDDRSMK